MIIGYQVQNRNGEHWAGRPSNVILTEETAVREYGQARTYNDSPYKMIAILEGDIEHPVFENSLTGSGDQYKVLGVSTAHLKEEDHKALSELAADPECNVCAGRTTGWFIKLYENAESNLGYANMSDTFHKILLSALAAGYRMVEFDSAATVHEEFEVFE